MRKSEDVMCPRCGQVASCVDQWQRQYRCYSHGELTFLAPWYEKQQQEYADTLERVMQAADDPEANKPETRDKLRELYDQNSPWNACSEHDLRNPETARLYYESLEEKAND